MSNWSKFSRRETVRSLEKVTYEKRLKELGLWILKKKDAGGITDHTAP